MLLCAAGLAPAATPTPLTAAVYESTRRYASTHYGRIAYIERGEGPAALFLHGLPLNGFQWRGIIPRLAPLRRCLAPDFLGLGYTRTTPTQDLAPLTQSDMIAAFLHSLSIPSADVVASDSGGAIAQLLAARYPGLVRSLLLTNCDVDTNSPPKAMAPELEAARKGELAPLLARQLADPNLARSPQGLGGACYTNPSNLTDEALSYYLTPLVRSAERRAQVHRYILSFLPNPLPTIRPALRRCAAPLRIVWGTGDKYFAVEWAEWLHRTLPRSRGIHRVEGAKLFFPEEQPELIAAEAQTLWTSATRRP